MTDLERATHALAKHLGASIFDEDDFQGFAADVCAALRALADPSQTVVEAMGNAAYSRNCQLNDFKYQPGWALLSPETRAHYGEVALAAWRAGLAAVVGDKP